MKIRTENAAWRYISADLLSRTPNADHDRAEAFVVGVVEAFIERYGLQPLGAFSSRVLDSLQFRETRMLSTRDEFFQRLVTKEQKGIELGPSYNPAFPKKEGWNVRVVDYLDRAGLVAKYSEKPGVEVSRIEDVDYLVEGSHFSEAVPREEAESFDFIALSHTLEHLCDIIGFFEKCETLLKEDGLVIVAIPDKRFCFDFFRPVSTTGDVLRAHWEKRATHPADVLFESNDLACTNNGFEEWVIEHENPAFWFMYSNNRKDFVARSEAIERGTSTDYIDLHRWVFTPSSFLFVLRDLIAAGYLRFDVTSMGRGVGPNIFCALRKGGANPRSFELHERLHLQFAMAMEQQVQSAFLATAPEFAAALANPYIDAMTKSLMLSSQDELKYLMTKSLMLSSQNELKYLEQVVRDADSRTDDAVTPAP